jgi:hypothetical protein
MKDRGSVAYKFPGVFKISHFGFLLPAQLITYTVSGYLATGNRSLKAETVSNYTKSTCESHF